MKLYFIILLLSYLHFQFFLVMVSNHTFDSKIAAILAEGHGEGELTSVVYVSGEEVALLTV